MLRRKHERRLDDEFAKPLASYRAEELARMWINFFGADPSYHEARRRFVYKGNPPPQESRPQVQATAETATAMLPREAVENPLFRPDTSREAARVAIEAMREEAEPRPPIYPAEWLVDPNLAA
jgi:hypothetical protein